MIQVLDNPPRIRRGNRFSDDLTRRELAIVKALVDAPSYRLDRESLLELVWKGARKKETSDRSKTLGVHLTMIRKKLRRIQLDIVTRGDGAGASNFVLMSELASADPRHFFLGQTKEGSP